MVERAYAVACFVICLHEVLGARSVIRGGHRVDIAVQPGELRAVSFAAAGGIRREAISEGC